MPNRHAKRIRKQQVDRAIYIDFEGRANDEPPSMLGVLYTKDSGEEVLRQFVFDPILRIASLATGTRAPAGDATESADLQEALQWLVDLALAEKRTIVCWSKHDDEVLRSILGDGLGYTYRNAIAVAKPWAGRQDMHRPDGNTLQWFCEAVGYDVPEPVRSGAGTWIKTARDRIRTHMAWEPVTDTGKSAWRSLVEHNMHDLVGMRAVVRAVKGLPPSVAANIV